MAAVALAGASHAQWALPRVAVVLPDKTVIHAERADTPATRQRGLMFRQALAPNEGMLFVFDRPGSYPFWMQNCIISIDIIWLDAQLRILSIAPSVPPCRLANCSPPCASNDCPTYPHDGQALYVVEVASGLAKAHGLKPGDRLVIESRRRAPLGG